MSAIKAPWPVVHVHRYIDDTQTDPDTGTSPLVEDPPVVRKIVSITQVGRMRGSSHMVMDSGFEERVETSLRLTTLEPEKYASDDHVFLNPTLNEDGSWVSGSGTAYWVDGVPSDDRVGPWPRLLKQFGGVVSLHKVT